MLQQAQVCLPKFISTAPRKMDDGFTLAKVVRFWSRQGPSEIKRTQKNMHGFGPTKGSQAEYDTMTGASCTLEVVHLHHLRTTKPKPAPLAFPLPFHPLPRTRARGLGPRPLSARSPAPPAPVAWTARILGGRATALGIWGGRIPVVSKWKKRFFTPEPSTLDSLSKVEWP